MSLINTGKDDIAINTFSLFSTPTDNVSNVTIDGNPVLLPLVLTPGIHTLQFEFCPIQTGFLNLDFVDSDSISYNYSFPIQAALLSLEIGNYNVGTINFGDVTIGNSATGYLYLPDTIFECIDYVFLNVTSPFSIQPTKTVCVGDGIQAVPITFTPTTTTSSFQNFDIEAQNGCQTTQYSIEGRGVEAPEPGGGGNPVSPKRTVVDCPTSNCRLANGQPGFAQTTKNSINQISRVTRPKGGAGRGTNFR